MLRNQSILRLLDNGQNKIHLAPTQGNSISINKRREGVIKGGYIAKKAFDTDLASQRDQIWRNWELDKIVANFPDSSKEAYGELLEVNGCGSATAKRIIEKCKNRRELTEHEIDILSKAGLYGLSLYHPL